MAPAYALRDLCLGYQGHPVLRVQELEIMQGGMVFVLGASGTGKSTLLESIGLMSNTFMAEPGTQPAFSIDGTSYDPMTMWGDPSVDLTRIRRERFSFIFQNTNLMPNFTIGENIRMACFGHTQSEDDLDRRIMDLMDSLNLPHDTLEKPAFAVSGGQRQRVAFIRALVKDFSVLLADEPTGNLDPENAVVLFEVLKRQVAQRKATAVIVTHHVELAERFGDAIIELEADRPHADRPATVRVREADMRP